MTDHAEREKVRKVVAAFLAPRDADWQGLPVNVLEDGSWWVFDNGRWCENITAMPTIENIKADDSFAASPQEV